MYNIILSRKAKRMLEEHIAFIKKVDYEAAVKTKELLVKSISSLKEMPHRCLFFNEEYIVKNKYRKLVVNSRYIVLFQIKDKTVFVDYIIDTRQNYQFLIR